SPPKLRLPHQPRVGEKRRLRRALHSPRKRRSLPRVLQIPSQARLRRRPVWRSLPPVLRLRPLSALPKPRPCRPPSPCILPSSLSAATRRTIFPCRPYMSLARPTLASSTLSEASPAPAAFGVPTAAASLRHS